MWLEGFALFLLALLLSVESAEGKYSCENLKIRNSNLRARFSLSFNEKPPHSQHTFSTNEVHSQPSWWTLPRKFRVSKNHQLKWKTREFPSPKRRTSRPSPATCSNVRQTKATWSVSIRRRNLRTKFCSSSLKVSSGRRSKTHTMWTIGAHLIRLSARPPSVHCWKAKSNSSGQRIRHSTSSNWVN